MISRPLKKNKKGVDHCPSLENFESACDFCNYINDLATMKEVCQRH